MTIEETVKNLPKNPGVYIMYDENDEVIYVGKAKNLKNRVSSYFRKNSSHTPKVSAMVSNVARFEYIIVETEFEALVLECNLIKQYMPYYNILLKDDKAYPYIKITVTDDFPKVLLCRKIKKDGEMYFGPYPNTRVINETIDLVKTVFNIRSCNRVLPRDIGKARPCLNYQIKKCSAPCAGIISREEYRGQIDKVIDFLNGKHSDVIGFLEKSMYEASSEMNFERAAKIRDKINSIRQIREKQKITSTNLNNKDVISIADIGVFACIMVLIVRDGKMLNREHFVVKKEPGETNQSLMTDFIKQRYSFTDFIPNKIVLETQSDDMELLEKWLCKRSGYKISLTVAVKGENKRLAEMSKNNALEILKLHILNMDEKKRKMDSMIYRVKETLGLKKPPMRIESYDISNISGADSVGVYVVFENGQPKRSRYRIFNIKSVTGPDDYESIRETLYRRLENGVLDVSGFELPDLILIDGGKGHVKSAKEIVDFYKLDIPVFGLVKDDKHRTRGVTTENCEIGIKRTDPLFSFFTKIQDETHRFAVKSFHTKHKNSSLKSELLDIKGVGEAKKNKLLYEFKSIERIKNASVDELSKAVDTKTANNIYDYFHQKLT